MKLEFTIDDCDLEDLRKIREMMAVLKSQHQNLSDYAKNTCVDTYHNIDSLLDDYERDWIDNQTQRLENLFRLEILGEVSGGNSECLA